MDHMKSQVTAIINFTSSASFLNLHEGLEIVCSGNGFVVGETLVCSCTSDIGTDPVWYITANDEITYTESSGNSSSLTIMVTTDNYGDVYTCTMSSGCGDQERNITVDATGTYMPELPTHPLCFQ